MKNKWLIVGCLLVPAVVPAQNVGIGTEAPSASLHLRGNTSERLRLENAAALALNVRNDIVFRTGSFFTGQIRTVGTGINTARLGFYTGVQSSVDAMSERLTIADNGAIGIGTVTPQHPLTFNSVLGDKISFWGGTGSATVGHYGIGIDNSALQIFTANLQDDVVFGYGRSAALVETMRIRGNGNVGIGTGGSLPTARLHVRGTVRIADGSEASDKVLVSSSNGTASWANAQYFRISLGTQVNSEASTRILSPAFLDNGDSFSFGPTIDFANREVIISPAGVYQINLRVLSRRPSPALNGTVQASIERLERGVWKDICFGYELQNRGQIGTDAIFNFSSLVFLNGNERLRVRVAVVPNGAVVGNDFDSAGGFVAEFSGLRVR